MNELRTSSEAQAAGDRASFAAFDELIRSGRVDAGAAKYFTSSAERRRVFNISEATGAGGGYMLPTRAVAAVAKLLPAATPILSLSRVVETETGAPMIWPALEENSQGAGLVPEGQTSTNADPSISAFVFGTTPKFTSGIVAASFEALQDSAADIANELVEIFARRLGRALEAFFAMGSGVSQPQGVFVGAPVGVMLPAGNTTSVTSAGLSALYASVDANHRQSSRCAWLMSDSTWLAVQQIAAAQNWPLWFSAPTGAQPTSFLFGKPVVISSGAPPMGASAKPIVFGNFDVFAVRLVKGVVMLRMDDSRFVSKGEVGFQAFLRADSRFTAATTTGVCLLQNSVS
ncbi:phage major capsid protein [Methylocella sp.]|uniref:phage major capsid protein n=1 Tax=Methylocella sp. TaxID=1978226 RepID=UPI00378523E5